jgi:hypothetical protein
MEAGTHPVAQALADLARAFPQKAISLDTLRVYRRELDDLDPAAVAEACRMLTRLSEFFPTVRAIREQVAEAALALPSETEALAIVDNQRRPFDPTVKQALDAVGGMHAWRSTSEPAVLRGQFVRAYRELRASAIRSYVVGDLALEAGPQLRELTA